MPRSEQPVLLEKGRLWKSCQIQVLTLLLLPLPTSGSLGFPSVTWGCFPLGGWKELKVEGRSDPWCPAQHSTGDCLLPPARVNGRPMGTSAEKTTSLSVPGAASEDSAPHQGLLRL